MVLSDRGTFHKAQKSRHNVSIPQPVVKDSKFPFEPGERVKVTIDPDKQRLVIEKIDVKS